MSRLRSRRWLVRGAALALYVGLALWTTWPVARAPMSTLPVGSEPVATVPMFNLWTMWWNVDRLGHGFAGYWDAPIFHPTDDALAFSEVQPLTVVLAPIVWLTGSRVLAYNVWLWLSLVLNGVLAERLLRGLHLHRGVAIGGGAAMVLLPIVHWQLGVEQLVPIWGILWIWDASRRATFDPGLARGAVVGLAFSVAYLLCGHHGLFLSVLLLAGGVWFPGTRLFSRRGLLCWGTAGVVALLLAGPFVWKHEAVFAKHETFARSEQSVRSLSLRPGDYTVAKGTPLLDVGDLSTPQRRTGWGVASGWLKVAFALAGIGFGLWRRRLQRWTAWLLTLAGLAFALSLGPRLDLWGWQPWSVLVAHYPGFAQVRSAFRFAFFVQMAVVLFAAVGVHCSILALRRHLVGPAWRWTTIGTVTLIGLLAVVEIRPAAITTYAMPDVGPHRGWITFVRDETPAGRAIICLPMAAGRKVGDFESTTLWMYLGTHHGRPLVNGYSGFFPTPYNTTQANVNAAFPTEWNLRRLAGQEVEFVVVDRNVFPAESLAFVWYDGLVLQHAYGDDTAEIDVYRIVLSE